jgi:GrpB-like predicted nucleotidyltransferase (UPF0157 family)
MITLISDQERWPAGFLALGGKLRQALDERALRIDHVGSTSVPGLGAKDVIDTQVTVAALQQPARERLVATEFAWLQEITADHIPAGAPRKPGDWDKWIFEPQKGQRAANMHVRVAGGGTSVVRRSSGTPCDRIRTRRAPTGR